MVASHAARHLKSFSGHLSQLASSLFQKMVEELVSACAKGGLDGLNGIVERL